PAAHYLESWSDARAFDGTASIVQPLIAPLYDGKSAHEVLAAFSPSPERSGYELVRATWQMQMKGTSSRAGARPCTTASSRAPRSRRERRSPHPPGKIRPTLPRSRSTKP